MSYFDKSKNRKERLNFVVKWANFVRSHPDKEWSQQQRVLINSQMKGARKQFLSLKEYLDIKNKIHQVE